MANNLREMLRETLWRTQFADSESDEIVQEKKSEWSREYDACGERSDKLTAVIRKWLESEETAHIGVDAVISYREGGGGKGELRDFIAGCNHAALKSLSQHLEGTGE